MNQQGNGQGQGQPGTIINVKRVRKGTDSKEREKVVLTFGTDKDGRNGLDALLNALEQHRGKQVNFDIRLGKQQTERGAAFDTAFVIVKEMIPLDQKPATYVSKGKGSSTTAAKAQKIQEQFE